MEAGLPVNVRLGLRNAYVARESSQPCSPECGRNTPQGTFAADVNQY